MFKTLFFAFMTCFAPSRIHVVSHQDKPSDFLDVYCQPTEKPTYCRCIVYTYDVEREDIKKTTQEVLIDPEISTCDDVRMSFYPESNDLNTKDKQNFQPFYDFYMRTIDVSSTCQKDLEDRERIEQGWHIILREAKPQIPRWHQDEEQ